MTGRPAADPAARRAAFGRQHLLARGVPIATVAARLGHSVTVCEKTYRHYIPRSDAAAAAVMAEVMNR